jgi:hypothetical protein
VMIQRVFWGESTAALQFILQILNIFSDWCSLKYFFTDKQLFWALKVRNYFCIGRPNFTRVFVPLHQHKSSKIS